MSSVDRPTSVIAERATGRDAVATREAILDAARARLLEDGFVRLSTRGVAEGAAVPLSQLHYHFGSKQGMILALLEAEDERRLARQSDLYGEERPLWERYEQACDFLEVDLEEGYVRVLQEMIAVGWSDPAVGTRVHEMLQGWIDLLTGVVGEAEREFGPFGPFSAAELAALIGQAFMGGEAMLLLGFDSEDWPIRRSLRRIGTQIRQLEESNGSNDDA
jgi:AcrR family transcriptional regulator